MGHWKKGALHCHTLWSDGRTLPEMAVHTYREMGYDFVCISDHNVFQDDPDVWLPVMPDEGKWPSSLSVAEYDRIRAALPDVLEEKQVGFRRYVRLRTFAELRKRMEQPGKFLLLPGEEITVIDSDFGEGTDRKYHLHWNVFNPPGDLPIPSDGSASDLLRRGLSDCAAASGSFVMLNHPFWRVWDVSPELLIDLPEIKLFEICNSGTSAMPENWIFPREKFWDFVLAHRLSRGLDPVYGTATDDAHYYDPDRLHQPNGCGTAWVMLRCPGEFTNEAIRTALLSGDFYASCGVSLEEIAFDPGTGTLRIRVQEEPGTHYRIDFIATGRDFDRSIVHCDFPRTPLRDSRIRPMIREDVGRLVKRTVGTAGEYTLSPNDLYVRAVVVSDRPPLMRNPFYPEHPSAWTQPFCMMAN